MKPSIRCLTTALGLVASCQASWTMADPFNTCEWRTVPGPMTHFQDVGTLYIPRDAPVGSIIGTERMFKRTHNNEGLTARCYNNGDVRLIFNAEASAPPATGIYGGLAPMSVLRTNIPGVGALFSLGFPFDAGASNAFVPDHGDTTVPFNAHNAHNVGVTFIHISLLESRITLIKTGPIPPGPQTFDNTELFSGRVTGIAGKVFTAGLAGTVIQAHCGSNTVSADPVELGEWDQRDFTGPGYTTTAIPFKITLSDCAADPSNANITTAHIQFEDASAAPVPPSVPGVFGLSPDSTAQGIGIQILKSDGTTPVELNTPVPLIPISASGTVLDFTARFYQTGPSRDVHPGIAKGALNFTLTYR